ncbi:hypothetical protein TSOC_011381 [Tetrabaena socialis]|uniref:Hexosyltransferase n=1 Tax=Tetrabaena socialis TaxID=47790 RepID=A0A2J7ZQT5_9CHLO|nr:hypothetical protein TSOC_011381 [Tetrabaena socialis]|eukprot:PNH02635.1 hypothetical protein TSOC_011381 [Tetrabaena socialis]
MSPFAFAVALFVAGAAAVSAQHFFNNYSIYSYNKNSIELQQWQMKLFPLLPSNLTTEFQHLSSAKYLEPQSRWPKPEDKIRPLHAKAVKVFIGIFVGRYKHVEAKFVVGLYADPARNKSLSEEMETHGDFLVLNVNDAYSQLTDKTRHYFAAVYKQYPAVEYFVKMGVDGGSVGSDYPTFITAAGANAFNN